MIILTRSDVQFIQDTLDRYGVDAVEVTKDKNGRLAVRTPMRTTDYRPSDAKDTPREQAHGVLSHRDTNSFSSSDYSAMTGKMVF